MIEDNLALPFQTRVLGVDVTVENIELKNDRRIVAVCVRGETRQAISLARNCQDLWISSSGV
jgi:hypothetical protein